MEISPHLVFQGRSTVKLLSEDIISEVKYVSEWHITSIKLTKIKDWNFVKP